MLDSPLILALDLIASGDAAFLRIVGLSLSVSLSALALACALGLPLGAALALARFPGRTVVVVILNALMGLPPVVAGLAIYLLLSNAGPLGVFGLLYSPTGMVLAQTVLILPIVASLTRAVVEELWAEYAETLTSLGAGRWRVLPTLLMDGRVALATAVLAGFGRASAEVGAVMIVGGNIAGHTRTMTTAITVETGRGNLAMAMALGMVLLALTLGINALAWGLTLRARRAGFA